MATKAEPGGISAAQLTERIDSFLASRGIKPAGGPAEVKSPHLQTTAARELGEANKLFVQQSWRQ